MKRKSAFGQNRELVYRTQVIVDPETKKTYVYDEDPEEYKKARKRQQNRESAIRSRARKRDRSCDMKEKV